MHHESNGRHWWKNKWAPHGVEKKRTDTYPNLRYLATDLRTYSITSWLTKGITVGWGLRPIRLEYKNITPFFLNNRKWKVNRRLFSCCGHSKYILSHENQKVRPRRWYILESHNGFLQLMQAGWISPVPAGAHAGAATGFWRYRIRQTRTAEGMKASETMWIRKSPSLPYFVL